MAYFDYSLPQTLDLGKAIEPIGDALTEVLNRRQKQRQFDEEMAFKRDDEARKYKQAQMNIDYQNRIVDETQKRDRFKFRQQQNEYKSKQGERVRNSLAAGNPQDAERIASETELMDPDTGAVSHGSLTPGQMPNLGPAPSLPPEPVQPQGEMGPAPPPEIMARLRGLKRPEPQPGALVGPIPDAETARRAEIQRIAAQPPSENVPDVEGDLAANEAERKHQLDAREMFARESRGYQQQAEGLTAQEQARLDANGQAQTKFEGNRAAYDQAVDELPQQQKNYREQRTLAENSLPYTLRFGNGPEQKIDMQTQRYSTRQAAAQDFLSSLPAAMDQQTRAAAEHAHAAILAGERPEKALENFQAERVGAGKQDFAGQQGDLNRQNKIDVANINAKKPGMVLQERKFQAGLDKDLRKETRGDVEKWLKASGLDKAPDQLAAMKRSIEQLKGNGREQQAALVGMARATQGDNRFSDADYRVFVEHGGVGTLDQLENTMQKIEDGGFGEQTIAVAAQMANALHAMFEDRLKRAGSEAKEQFVHNSDYDPHVADSVLEERLGKAYYQRETARGGGPPELNARRKGAAASSSKTVKINNVSTDDLLNMVGK